MKIVLKIVIDIPGFAKEDIKLTLCGDILSIKAQKTVDGKESEDIDFKPKTQHN